MESKTTRAGNAVTGVVIGKFYPPHRGHKFLIDTARAQVDRLFVIVCDHPEQTIPGQLRQRWLKEIHPDCEILLTADDLPDEPGPWSQRTIEVIGHAPDMVFSSELYGDDYAKMMGARHVLVDLARETVPVSGTKVRQDPATHRQLLEPCVQAYFLPRVILVGAESTGKTTLAQKISEQFNCEWVPEYGREFSEVKMPSGEPWTSEDFVHIAEEQQRREDQAARQSSSLLVCDTNAWATGTWHERYVGDRSAAVDKIGKLDAPGFYLVPDPSVPFVQDGFRDGEHIRGWMHDRFVELLSSENKQFAVLSGGYQERLEQAINLIKNRL